MIKHLLILLFIFNILIAQAQIQFQHLDDDDGLAHNDVECFLHDSYGYIWIGTYGGISKYDGYSFQNYTIFDSISPLPSNTIFVIFEDENKNIWVGTNREMVFYNRKKDLFEKLEDIPKVCITGIAAHPDGTLWLSTFSGLMQIDKENKKHLRTIAISDGLPSETLTDLSIDTHGRIWVGTHNSGIFSFNPINDKIKINNTFHENSNNSIAENHIKSLRFDTKGNLWIGTVGSGISKLDTTTHKYYNYIADKTEPLHLGHNYVSCVYIDPLERVWACRNGFLCLYDSSTNNFHRYLPNEADDAYLENKNIGKISSDRNNNLLIGSYGNGINTIKTVHSNFTTYNIDNITFKKNNLNIENIRTILYYNENILLGSDGSGLYFFDPKNKSITPFKYNHKLPSTHIMSIEVYNSKLWCTSWGGGSFIVDLKTNEINKFALKDHNNNILNINNIRYIEIFNDTAWLGTSGDGLIIYDIKRDKFLNQQYTKDFNLKVLGWISSIIKDSKNTIWIATFDGVYRFENNIFTKCRDKVNNAPLLSDEVVHSMFEDSESNIWFATNKGIDMYNRKTDEFKQFSQITTAPRQPKSFIEDNDKNIWISANDGIYKYTITKNEFEKFSPKKGILPGKYSVNGSFKDKIGDIYFGGNKGFVTFNPQQFIYDSTTPYIAFRNLYKNYKKVAVTSNSLPVSLDCTDTITIDYSNAVYSLEIIDLNFKQNSEIDFSYLIEGYSNQWITIDETRKISLSNLAPNTYKIIVKACYDDINCSQKQLTLKILPPWWMTTWLKITVIVLISLLIFLIVRLRFKIVKNQNRLLKKKVSEKTEALQSSNEKLLEQYTKLKEKEFLLQIKNDELEASNSTKNKLFSIIAHDFKNPFLVILGYSEKLKDNLEITQQAKREVLSIFNASKSIYNQLETLLNWSLSQTKAIKSNPTNIDVEFLIKENSTLLMEKAQTKKIQIAHTFAHSNNAFVDKDMFHIVFRNIFTNAIKFTPQNGKIAINTYDTEDFIAIEIKDTGVGMTPETVDKLFNSSTNTTTPYRLDNEKKGTGLGLIICKELLKSNNAKIEVHSTPDVGSTFRVYLPMGEK
ncbi:MAG: hypothetical protein IPO21_19975 [Bacteroidales bacterium]|nr:hypothetical protein [Bacteroidales bacterium]